MPLECDYPATLTRLWITSTTVDTRAGLWDTSTVLRDTLLLFETTWEGAITMADVDTIEDDDETPAGKRAVRCKRTFRSADGEITSRSSLDVEAVIFEFPNGYKFTMELSDLFPEGLPPPSVGRAAAAAGVNTSVGNVFGGITDAEEAIEAAESRWQTLTDGAWSAERKTGPRTSDLIEAWAAFRVKNGAPDSPEWRAMAKDKILKREKTSKDLLVMPGLKAEYDAIRAKRAADRAEKSRAAAASGAPQDFGDLLS